MIGSLQKMVAPVAVFFATLALSAEAHGGEMHMPSSNSTYVLPHTVTIIHGICMLAVFGFLVPAIAASARAKSKNHRYIAMATITLATFAILIMFPVHGVSFDNGHAILGWTMICAMYFQAFMGFRASRMKKELSLIGKAVSSSSNNVVCSSVDFVRKFHRVFGRGVLCFGVMTGWTGMCMFAGVFERGPIARNEFIGHSLTSIAFFFFGYSTWAYAKRPMHQAFLEGGLFIVAGSIYIFLDVVTTVDWSGRFKAMSFQQHVSLACLWIFCGCLTLVLRAFRIKHGHNAPMAIALFAHSFGMMTHPQDTDLGKYLHILHGGGLIVGIILRFAKQYESAALFFAVAAMALLCGQDGVVEFGIDVGMDSTAFMVSAICFLIAILVYHVWLWSLKYPHPESEQAKYEMIRLRGESGEEMMRSDDKENTTDAASLSEVERITIQ